MHYGIFIIDVDGEGLESVGRMVHNCDTWTGACRFIRAAIEAGVLEDGTAVPDNGLKALELEVRPWGDKPPRIRKNQAL